MTDEPITNRVKLACVERELTLRRNVYPRMIKANNMSEARAAREIAIMAAIVDDYRNKEPT